MVYQQARDCRNDCEGSGISEEQTKRATLIAYLQLFLVGNVIGVVTMEPTLSIFQSVTQYQALVVHL